MQRSPPAFMFTSLSVLSILIASSFAELVFVQAIFRHGDRAPSSLPYPGDKNTLEKWPRGWGELTNLGISQTYKLGDFLHKRYVDTGFLSKDGRIDEVLILTSEAPRSIMSSLGMTASLFVPQDASATWNSNLTWQPFPVHQASLAPGIDPLLRPDSLECAAYDQVKDEENKEAYDHVAKTYAPLYEFVSTKIGQNMTYKDNGRINDLQREIIHQMPQPDWVTAVVPGLNKTVIDLAGEVEAIIRPADFNSLKKSYYRGGLLLNHWLERFENFTAKPDTQKAVLYSSHDGTVSALMYAMGVGNNLLVPYAALFIAELHTNGSDYSVKLFYHNTTTEVTPHEPYPLTLPNCTEACPLTKVLQNLKSMRITTYDQLVQECQESASTIQRIFVTLILPSFTYLVY